ncbi:collagen-like protein [uncultured Gelidibacter sp.]|uniref:collagen-like triple helix repeat-containing protein n=1 Tax=uncultured Gelidibacter sp. TaxID=259318 RepID=UPI00260AA696|nr:collagen-like protein [uncultured Gelidibacter sp.]
MKKIATLLFVLAITLTACTGDQGPMGPPGFDGIDGVDGADGGIIVSSAFEIDVNFTADNNYSYTENYGFEVLPSDVTLVYILWETNNGTDIWRMLPQSVYFDDGTLVYNYDFTRTDVRFFLDGTKKFNTLDAEWTQNQTFRVVVVPADNVDGVDISNLNEVMQATNITHFDIK